MRFVTTSILSDDADNVAKKLHIRLMGLEYMPEVFPIVKCKTNADGKGVYYLPTDSQYDDITLNLGQGDFYCLTVKEAEEKGFTRGGSPRMPRIKPRSIDEIVKSAK